MIATTVQEAWDEFYGDSEKCRRRREEADLEIKNLFPDDNSLKLFLEELYQYVLQNEKFTDKGLMYLNYVHPRAWKLILEYGKNYHPRSFESCDPRKSKPQPTKNKCYANSCQRMFVHNEVSGTKLVTYIEGFAAGVRLTPMLHAWNGRVESGDAIDWTFYVTTVWTRYFGISFTHDEYNFITSNTNGESNVHSLFDKVHFEKVEEKILKVLERRNA